MKNDKAKHYAGLLVLLKHENLCSIALYGDMRASLARGLNLTLSEFDEYLDYANKNLDVNVSCVYIDWK